MKARSLAAVLLLGLASVLGVSSASEPTVYVIRIQGTIDPATADYLESTLRAAQKSQASAVVVELDTPGGLVSSVRSMAEAIYTSDVPVIVYTAPSGAAATSAGALLMLSSHVAAMAPGTNVGAAHPVGADGKGLEGAQNEKAVQDTAAFARGQAELRGRDTALAQELVEKSRSLTAPEALAKKLIDVMADNRGELLQKIDGRVVKLRGTERKLRTAGAQIVEHEMTLGQKLMHLLAHPNVAAVLMTLAMLLIYVEVSHPGITVAGVLGVACLLVAFMAFQVLPIRVGGVAFLGLGLLMMILEAFVVTGGWLAAAGVVSFVLGLLWFVDPAETNLAVSLGVLIPAALALATVAGIVTLATARMRKLSAETLSRIGGGGTALGLAGYVGEIEMVQDDGLAGKARFRGELWNVESAAALRKGQQVRVKHVKGFTAVVEPVDKA